MSPQEIEAAADQAAFDIENSAIQMRCSEDPQAFAMSPLLYGLSAFMRGLGQIAAAMAERMDR